jgi:hypothetical protein
MNRDNILKYINHPGRLDQRTLPEIEELLDAFPYFQTAYLLHVKNHHNIKSLKFNDSLRSASARIGDRALLYHLIHDMLPGGFQEKQQEVPGKKPVSKPEANITRENLQIPDTKTIEVKPAVQEKEKYISPVPEEEITSSVQDEKKSLSAVPEEGKTGKTTYPFAGWFEHLDEKTPAEQEKISAEEKRLKDTELIDAFIKTQPKITPGKAVTGAQEDISEAFIRHEDQLMTETLAQVYFKQGYYLKAIHIYEKLSLKFPEKSSYFATQINKIIQCIS